MYDLRPNTLIGFHGCDLEIRNKLVNNPQEIEISSKPYDWLGHGMYFWENNYTRAMEWATERVTSGKFKKAAVLGAVLQLGNCCDLLDSKFTALVGRYGNLMLEEYKSSGKDLPVNSDAPQDRFKNKLIRQLDCTVIENMHQVILKGYRAEQDANEESDIQVFDSTRGAFSEGGPAFAGSNIELKSHIQICIRNMNCIKGFFIPREEIPFPLI